MNLSELCDLVYQTESNVWIDADTVVSHLSIPLNTIERAAAGECITFMGFRMLIDGAGFIIFKQCQWCKMTDGKLDKRNCCGHCGGYIN
jgi:hypothetical protein